MDILERIIQTSTREGQTVLDMFGGSGSTAVAAYNTGRRYIINEGDPKTFRKMKKRLAENEAQISIDQYLQSKDKEKEREGEKNV